MATLHVPLSHDPYDLEFADALSTGAGGGLGPHVRGRYCLVVSDSTVAPLYLDQATELLRQAGAAHVGSAVFPAGEENKHLGTLQQLYGEAVRQGLDRSSVVVALGGGVVGDTAGFLAATYMRGIAFVQIPTTLLAQVDSAIGGKTGVDLPEGKNMVGAFYQPRHVLIDVHTFETLPERQLQCGLAEVIKYGVIMDADFFDWLEARVDALNAVDLPTYEQVVWRCCQCKADVVVEDEKELTGRRAILNYGHTFGHGIEKLSGYSRYTHGEAIAIGMSMAADLARILGDSPELAGLVARQDALFQAVGLPTRVSGLDPAALLAAMRTDKKYEKGRNRLILPSRVGAVSLVKDVAEDAIAQAIEGRCDQ